MIHPPAEPSTDWRRRRQQVAVSADPDQRYINREQLRALIPTSDMTLWRWKRDPRIAFPAAVKLGADGRNYWWLPAIHLWMRQRRERRPQRPAGGQHRPPSSHREQQNKHTREVEPTEAAV